ncbi:SMG-like protein 1 [Paramyrothecium foliicola]|nr:SMG-like protein 1 [Paramyrothecium foliicola]
MDLSKGWVNYLRNSSRHDSSGPRLACPLCDAEINQTDLESFRSHVLSEPLNHSKLKTDSEIEEAHKIMVTKSDKKPRSTNTARLKEDHAQKKPSKKRPMNSAQEHSQAAGETPSTGPGRSTAAQSGSSRSNKKLCSPPPSVDQRRESSPATPNRSRARQNDSLSEFSRGQGPKNPSGRQLWNPNDEPLAKTPQSRQPSQTAQTRHQIPQGSRANRPAPQQNQDSSDHGVEDPSTTTMVKEPETRPISQDQLINEVKGIYAGLVMVESKCIEVDNAQSSNTDADHKLSNEQWQALIALHRTLLHEHHDFFLASQHPSASPALRRLASKYAMPARMWRHGIHSFLELLRHKLPLSLEHMLSFIYLSYSIMALLYETVPTFEETWIECLGDLGRYRMAIEDDDIRDREVWTGVSKYWYSKASEKSPRTGRLYHHLAILARPNALQQLYYYTKSLCVPIPFPSARESIMTLFDPVLNGNANRLQPIDAAFVRAHGILISGKCQDQLELSMNEFLDLLDGHIGRTTKKWSEAGYFIGIAIGCLLLEYGTDSNVLMRAMSQRPDETDVTMDNSTITEQGPGETFTKALSFSMKIYEIVIRRWGDVNTFPYLHTTFVFLAHMASYPAAMAHLEKEFPWKLTAVMLNFLMQSCEATSRIESPDFPRPPKNEIPRPLPEDYAMRGLIYAEEYFPNDWWLNNDKIDEDEKYFELASMVGDRRERILWLGRKIARCGKWLIWKDEERKFDVVSEYDVQLDGEYTTGAA